MKSINLLRASLENFKCFRKRLEVEFPKEGGFYFLGGKNLIEPRLGANGAGKSSLWDGIFWCLYGASITGDRASDLASWGEKRPNVQVQLQIDGQPWTIARIGSPEKITIQNFDQVPAPAAQADIDNLLGLTKARFGQAVLFGQGVRMFLDLTVPERGALLDEVLDLGYWERLADLAASKAKRQDLELKDVERDIQFVSGKLEGLTPLEELRAAEAEWSAQQDARMLELCDRLESAENHLAALETEMQDVKAPAPAQYWDELIRQVQTDIISAQRNNAAALSALRQAKERADFFVDNAVCPSCEQPIDPSRADEHAQAYKETITKEQRIAEHSQTRAQALADKLSSLQDEQRAHREAIRQFENAQAAQAAYIRNAKQAVKGLLADIDAAEAGAKRNPITAQISQRAERAAALDAELAGHQDRKTKICGALRHMDYWRQGFKRVKLYLIKRALDVLQIETQAASSQLGLLDWKISYVTETETKSGTLKSGVQILIKALHAPGAASLQSGGERQRARLAISIGLSNMIQRMAGVDYGFEIWDEPSAWLSPEGIADLTECLADRAASTGKQLWIIDHRVYDSTTFSAAYIMVKSAQGSCMERLA